MPIIALKNIHLAYGTAPLLDRVDLCIEPRERICLIGRNGAGKSTLMKLISGEIAADEGERVVGQGMRIARLEQEVPAEASGSVFDVVAEGLEALGGALKDYHHISLAVADDPSEANLALMARIQHELEAANGWQVEQRVETVLSRLNLNPDTAFAALSGGLKRRVLLARALVMEPDLLLLDEPTNHLDIESIQWLEEFLLNWNGSLLFVTHDRAFLRRLATRILELDRGGLTDWPGDYDNFVRRKEERLNAEEKANERFDKKLAQEEVWIRQGIKARRTRNEGRVRALKQLREEFNARRHQQGQARMQLQEAERSGKLVVEAIDVAYAWGDKAIVRNLSTLIMRGDRIGLIGPNGAGKSTLLNLLLGRLQPDSGSLRMGTNLEIAFYDQMRAGLDEEKSVIDNVAGGSDKIDINGKPKHIISYLQDFLFAPDRVRQPVKALSGGERNRLMLAKLFAKPANLLVLDEPTNDLDVETLELLEELLLDYQGTLLLVSHDRDFLDNVVTSSLVFEGDGRVGDYVGGYSEWLRQRKGPEPAPRPKTERGPAEPEPAKEQPRKKLSYKDQRELETLPGRIEALERRLLELQAALADPALYQVGGGKATKIKDELDLVEAELATAYARWEELEALRV
ncbi:MAG: ATP-binding cassette domain-containing protein [Gammaproteobacteria bacterium]|nr:ATP-binding cassette domain-containing protein [Gammaproteobacteria bacterium]MBU1653307.1 ATP-binding cassette domain-containing protein [Gammaproteobacteria bacterium]MBU1962447.1 ATP-binding cassette domain-containing protein [Gammaproteobacteria bacterium]